MKDKTESRGTLALRRGLRVNPPSSPGRISNLSTSIFSDESRWMGREEEWHLRTRTEEFLISRPPGWGDSEWPFSMIIFM